MTTIGLYFYRARYYDPALSRFTSADFIVPLASQGVQAWDRYAFVNNNPLRYNDPSGHYGKDVHYDLTYQVVYDIAIAAADERGYSPQGARDFANNLASEVSRGDMAADAMKVVNGKEELALEYFRENNPIRRPGSEAPGLSIAPHWYTTDQAETALQEAKDPFDFGIAMHKYQDSFAHWQKLGKPNNPGEIWDKHALNHLPGNKNIDDYRPSQNTEFGKIDATMTQGMYTYTAIYINKYFKYGQLE